MTKKSDSAQSFMIRYTFSLFKKWKEKDMEREKIDEGEVNMDKIEKWVYFKSIC